MNEHHRRGIVSRVLRNACFEMPKGEIVYGGFLGEARTSCRVQVKM